MVEKLAGLEQRRLGWRAAALPFAVASLLVVVAFGFAAVAGLVVEHSVGSVAAVATGAAGTVGAFSQIAAAVADEPVAAAFAEPFDAGGVGVEEHVE